MGRVGIKNSITISIIASAITISANAESLFKMGVSHTAYPIQPRSLYSSVKAKTVGDLVTVVIDENFSTSDDLQLEISKDTSVENSFSTLINKLLPGKLIPDEVSDYGGAQDLGSDASVTRTTKFSDTITAQVVQILPNGNLVIQGKKVAVNAGETVNIIISGIVDPRFLNGAGQIASSQVANLQVAMSGKGTISRSNSEGTVNKVIRYLF